MIADYKQGTRRLLYTAGPIRDLRGDYWVEENIRAARETMLVLVRWGYAVHCPHTQSSRCHGVLPNDYIWLDVDREVIGRCDGVVFLRGWKKSEGSLAEYAYAIAHGIPVFDWEQTHHRQMLIALSSYPQDLWDAQVKNFKVLA